MTAFARSGRSIWITYAENFASAGREVSKPFQVVLRAEFSIDEGEGIHVEKAPIRHLEMRDDRQGKESHLQEGFG